MEKKSYDNLFTYTDFFDLSSLNSETASGQSRAEQNRREKSPTMVAHSGSKTLKKRPEINSLTFVL